MIQWLLSGSLGDFLFRLLAIALVLLAVYLIGYGQGEHDARLDKSRYRRR